MRLEDLMRRFLPVRSLSLLQTVHVELTDSLELLAQTAKPAQVRLHDFSLLRSPLLVQSRR